MDLVCGGCGARTSAPGERCDRCEPCWYGVLDGTLIGPITRDELARALRAQPGSADAPVWREGVDEWAPAREVPEIVAAIRAAGPSQRAPARALTIPPPPIRDLARRDEITGSGRVDLGALLATSRARPSLPPRPTITAEASVPPTAIPTSVAPRRSASFARGALLGACIVAAVAVAPMLASNAGEHDTAPLAIQVASAPLTPGPMFVEAAPLEHRDVAHQDEVAPPVVRATDEDAPPPLAPPPPPMRVTSSPAPAIRAQPSTLDEPEIVEATPPSEPVVAPPEAAPETSDEEPEHVSSIDALLEAAVDAPTEAEPSDAPSAPAPALPATPDREDVDRALTRAHSAVAACAEHGHGLAMVRITASGDTGRVTSAVVEGPLAGTPAGSCVARAVRGVTFTRFARESLTIEYPFRI
ncbi:GYF domain-containing protein [Sandaracinus amylolyticus]|uniref:GYF domain-containing protein n=1 Tax=Sandaracinus amylolyticus TaxID=927083 RepID=UPI001F15C100|nr:GYF domain-containing protein [Sandaracinus amylolyticus]UJR83126.1 Hypothetical protein I5071_51920 [Sandaracinus amylolyticus]